MCFILSFNKNMAKIDAKIGAKYLKETAVPIGKYLVDIKKRVMDVQPINPLKINNFLLFPKKESFCLEIRAMVMTNVDIDLKKTIWKVPICVKYFTTLFMQAKDKVLIIINNTAFLISNMQKF